MDTVRILILPPKPSSQPIFQPWTWLKTQWQGWLGVSSEKIYREIPARTIIPEFPALAERLRLHLDSFLVFQHFASESNGCCDRSPEAQRLANEARELSFEISLIPGFSCNPELQRASQALANHWHSPWSNGGVTEENYRVAVKGVRLFLAYAQRK